MCVLCTSHLCWCSASNKNHYVHYDDGEERWYQLTARQYSVLPELGEEVVGRKIAVEVTSRRWYVASIKAFEPDLHVHHFVYDDFPGEEEYADINSRYVSTVCLLLVSVCMSHVGMWLLQEFRVVSGCDTNDSRRTDSRPPNQRILVPSRFILPGYHHGIHPICSCGGRHDDTLRHENVTAFF
jgi:hypothetical protein